MFNRPFQVLLVLIAACSCATGLKSEEFRTCGTTSFCRRQRSLVGRQGSFAATIVAGSVASSADGSSVSGELAVAGLGSSLAFEVSAHEDLTLRLRVREKDGAAKARLDVAAALGLSAPPPQRCEQAVRDAADRAYVVICGGYTIVLSSEPHFVVALHRGKGRPNDTSTPPVASLNSQGLLHFETYEQKGSGKGVQGAAAAALDQRGLWEETFTGGGEHFVDQLASGPSAVGADVQFFGGKARLFGIPERAYSLQLPPTRLADGRVISEPYRLYNLDVYEYEAHHTMGLYGTVPFLMGVSEADGGSAAGMLWMNAAETYVDMHAGAGPAGAGKGGAGAPRATPTPSHAQWMSETGVIDAWLFGGSSPADVLRQYTKLSGRAPLPPSWALGYHQCRWNYKDEPDVAAVDAGFDEHDIPYDALWLDIEHTDEKKYFTWDPKTFPTPARMQDNLASRGRNMVVITDPHIKVDKDYEVYAEAQKQGLLVLAGDGANLRDAQLAVGADAASSNFEGKCWPGMSSWIDFANASAATYWAELYAKEGQQLYSGEAPLGVWNDMNEPSVFGGPETTMPKSTLHRASGHGKVEHRELHNMYGALMTAATHKGTSAARPGKRSFILTRAFFAGSQRHAAVWTGDNSANWLQLRTVPRMLLALSLSGVPFVGADVGGFFGNPTPELLVRWYQSAALQPFFRGHSQIDTRRREPWLSGELNTLRIKAAIRRRYALMPYIYGLFVEASKSGAPPMRPIWWEFPKEKHPLVHREDAWMLGPSLLVTHVARLEQRHIDSYFLPAGVWYDVSLVHLGRPGTRLTSLDWPGGELSQSVAAPIEQLPVAMRGGSVVPQRERARRSTRAMGSDPVTLIVALDRNGESKGSLVSDDGQSVRSATLTTEYSFGVAKGGEGFEKARPRFVLSAATRTQTAADAAAAAGVLRRLREVAVERVVVLGAAACPKGISVTSAAEEAEPSAAKKLGQGASVSCERQGKVGEEVWRVTVKKPAVPAHGAWTINLVGLV